MKKQHEIVSSEKTSTRPHFIKYHNNPNPPFMSSSSSSSSSALFITRKPLILILCFLLSLPLILLFSFSILTMAIEGDKGKEPMIDTTENVLQKHAAFFDRNHDGLIYPWETFQGFRAIGSGLALSTFASFFINLGLSGKTRPGKFPNLLFPIEVKNIAKSKHGSDSGVYDAEGRFVPAKFEELFQKHAHSNANALTSDELSHLLKANRVPKDYGGWLASFVEWKVLYALAKDKNGLLQKDTVRAVYDGSLFERMEKEKSSKHSKTAASM